MLSKEDKPTLSRNQFLAILFMGSAMIVIENAFKALGAS